MTDEPNRTTQRVPEGPGEIRMSLPWPPSVNHYWVRSKNGGMFIGSEGMAFRNCVILGCKEARVRPLSGRLELSFDAFQPDRRTRDLDNILKALLDAIRHGGCCEDDSQIKRIDARMHDLSEKWPAGRIVATLKRLPGPQCVQGELSLA